MKDFIVNTPELMNTVMKGFAILGSSYLDKSAIYSVENLPTNAKVMWRSTPSDFRISNLSYNSSQVFACKYNSEAQLNASIYYNDVLICERTKQIFSASLSIEGDTYLSAQEKRYKVNYIPYGGRLTWNVAPGMVIKEKGEDYIVITADKATNPWLRATVTANGTTTVKELKLHNEQLTGATMECLKTWRGTYDGQSRKKYAFRINYTPATIPLEDVTFCWNNNVHLTAPTDKPVIVFPINGVAKLITDGNIGICVDNLIKDSLVFRPVWPTLIQNDVMVTGPFEPDEDIIPYLWEHSVNHAVTVMPRLNTSGESRGYVSCKITDSTGKSVNTKSGVELFDKWQPVYHVSPNPAAGVLTVTRENGNESGISSYSTNAPAEASVNLFSNGNLIRSVSDAVNRAIRIDTSGLPDGNYTLNVLEEGKQVHSQVVIIKH